MGNRAPEEGLQYFASVYTFLLLLYRLLDQPLSIIYTVLTQPYGPSCIYQVQPDTLVWASE